jgi:hypothetical protein
VPLDFDWPLKKIWKGYSNPHYQACPSPTCRRGYTHGYWAFEHLIYRMAMAAHEAYALPRSNVARYGKPHPWVVEMGLEQLSPEFGEFVLRLCGEKKPPKDADTSPWNDFAETTRTKLYKAFCTHAKLPKNWGKCKTCRGHGVDPAVWPVYKAWKTYEPPKGTGYQVWETVSEGSPISPVFATAEEAVAWLVADQGHSEAGAKAFVKGGWASSMMGVTGGALVEGIDGLAIFGDSKQ